MFSRPDSFTQRAYVMALFARTVEHLVGYCARPALSQQRLVYAEKTNTGIYRTAPKEGKPEILVMSPIEYLQRWTLLAAA